MDIMLTFIPPPLSKRGRRRRKAAETGWRRPRIKADSEIMKTQLFLRNANLKGSKKTMFLKKESSYSNQSTTKLTTGTGKGNKGDKITASSVRASERAREREREREREILAPWQQRDHNLPKKNEAHIAMKALGSRFMEEERPLHPPPKKEKICSLEVHIRDGRRVARDHKQSYPSS